MFEQTFKNIDDILHKDAGCTSELDYTEQSSWLLFLKYLDALERDKDAAVEPEGKTFTYLLAKHDLLGHVGRQTRRRRRAPSARRPTGGKQGAQGVQRQQSMDQLLHQLSMDVAPEQRA